MTVMSQKQRRAINDAMPSTAKYGEVFEAIAKAQDEISFKAGMEAQLAKPDRLMDKEKLEKRIAELFRIAREEGPIRKWADGISDAKEILALIDPDEKIKGG